MVFFCKTALEIMKRSNFCSCERNWWQWWGFSSNYILYCPSLVL